MTINQVQSQLLEYGRNTPTPAKNRSVSALPLRLPPAPSDGAASTAAGAAATRYAAVSAGDDVVSGYTAGAAAAMEEQRGGAILSAGGEAEVGERGIGGAVGSDSDQPRRRVWV